MLVLHYNIVHDDGRIESGPHERTFDDEQMLKRWINAQEEHPFLSFEIVNITIIARDIDYYA